MTSVGIARTDTAGIHISRGFLTLVRGKSVTRLWPVGVGVGGVSVHAIEPEHWTELENWSSLSSLASEKPKTWRLTCLRTPGEFVSLRPSQD